jgi:hypothetical protein
LAEAVERTWPNLRGGGVTTKELSDVAWWFVRFSFLRNSLMHGRLPQRDDWLHDERPHIDLAAWYLREAIKHTVAADHRAIAARLRTQALIRKALRLEREVPTWNPDPDSASQKPD